MGGVKVNAFSGTSQYHFLKDPRPIPAGKHYTVGRSCFGSIGCEIKTAFSKTSLLRALSGYSNRSEWFALYATDNSIDDSVYCEGIIRRAFRLHPQGPQGICNGCITVEHHQDYQKIRAILKSTSKHNIPSTEILSYGTVFVK